MSKITFNEYQQRFLEANTNVASVSKRAIQNNPEFNIHALKEYQTDKGRGPAQKFNENVFDLTVIGSEKVSSSSNRWWATFKIYGEDAFFEKRLGKKYGPLF